MKCVKCDSLITNVLEKIELAFGDEVVILNNNLKQPSCVDCLQDVFFGILEDVTFYSK